MRDHCRFDGLLTGGQERLESLGIGGQLRVQGLDFSICHVVEIQRENLRSERLVFRVQGNTACLGCLLRFLLNKGFEAQQAVGAFGKGLLAERARCVRAQRGERFFWVGLDGELARCLE